MQMNHSRFGLPKGRFLVALALGLTVSGVHAQTQPAKPATSDDTTGLDELVVTGTAIRGLNAETSLPVQVVKAEDIARTGVTNTEDLFRMITAASAAGSTQTAQNTGTQTGALSAISLRGLGSGRTLVLVNGRRAAVYGGGPIGANGDSVDISTIPIAAIERVEILKDGASALYGSDAIAGVVNFILKSDYQGLEVNAMAGTPTRDGGGTTENTSVLGGFGDLKTDRYNVTLSAFFDHQSPILGASRPFASRYNPEFGNDDTSSFAFPANVTLPTHATGPGTITANPLAGNCGPASLNDANFPAQCRFDNDATNSLQQEQKKYGQNVDARMAVGDNSQLYFQESFAVTDTLTQAQPVPLSNGNPLLPGNSYIPYLANLLATKYPTYNATATGALPGTGAFLLPPTSPYYPAAFAAANGQAGQPLNLIYRDEANGPRLTEDVADAFRTVVGFKGSAYGWDYDTGFLYSESLVHENLLAGFAEYSEIMPLLDSGVINPFGPTNNPAALAQANADTFTGQDFDSKTSVTSLNGTASRAFFALPAGNVTGAVGVELRRETFDFNPAEEIQTGNVTGEGGNELPESAARSVESAFFETNAPLAKGLDVDAAVRWDHYQGVGSTVNPKGSIKWQPEDWVLVRTSAGTGFRAPSLSDLFAGQTRSVTTNGTRDYVQCATFSANNPACNFQFTTVLGGNPDLKPETSQNFSFGTVFQPVKNLSIDLDSFWIFLKDEITVGGLPYTTILANAGNEAEFSSFITRNSAGMITAIQQTNANLFKTNVSGLDMDLRYAFDLPEGRVSLLANGTYYYKYAIQNADGSWTTQLDQGIDTVGFVSRFRYLATAMYDINDFNFSVTQNFQKKYHDGPSSITDETREVSAYDTVDAQANYNGINHLRLTLGARNIFDKNPPYANYAGEVNNFVGGYDLSYGSPVGRFLYVSATYYLK
jgi:iron complex outermembrane recepter protein